MQRTHERNSGTMKSSSTKSSFQPCRSSIEFHRICSVLSLNGKAVFPQVHNMGRAFWHTTSPAEVIDTAIACLMKCHSFFTNSTTSASTLVGSTATLHFINCLSSQNRFTSYDIDKSTIGSQTISYIWSFLWCNQLRTLISSIEMSRSDMRNKRCLFLKFLEPYLFIRVGNGIINCRNG